MATAKSKKKAGDSVTHTAFSQTLSDCRSPMLRAGLAGLYMTLEAIASRKAPNGLHWKLEPDRVTIEFSDPQHLLWIIEQAWQEKEGVLYATAIHKSPALTADRMHFHNGMMGTFLQHNKVQPRVKGKSSTVDLDEKQFVYTPLRVKQKQIIYRRDGLKRLLKVPRGGWSLDSTTVELAGYILPGSPPRFRHETSWTGVVREAFLMMFAPLAAGFAEIEPKRGTWCVLLPDIDNLADFAAVRRSYAIGVIDAYAAGPADAALRYLVRMSIKNKQMPGCTIFVVGKVAWNKNQQVRRMALRVEPGNENFQIYKHMRHCFPNTIRKRKDSENNWVSTPLCAARIAENLIAGERWYRNFAEISQLHFENMEYRRKSARDEDKGSIQAIWFRTIQKYERKGLISFMENSIAWQTPEEQWFVEAFHAALRNRYGIEVSNKEKRGGSREISERFKDLNEEVRRDLTRAKTADIFRSVIANFWAAAGHVKPLEEHTAEIWRFVTQDWKCARDLALVALASYKVKEKISNENAPEAPEDNQ